MCSNCHVFILVMFSLHLVFLLLSVSHYVGIVRWVTMENESLLCYVYFLYALLISSLRLQYSLNLISCVRPLMVSSDHLPTYPGTCRVRWTPWFTTCPMKTLAVFPTPRSEGCLNRSESWERLVYTRVDFVRVPSQPVMSEPTLGGPHQTPIFFKHQSIHNYQVWKVFFVCVFSNAFLKKK